MSVPGPTRKYLRALTKSGYWGTAENVLIVSLSHFDPSRQFGAGSETPNCLKAKPTRRDARRSGGHDPKPRRVTPRWRRG